MTTRKKPKRPTAPAKTKTCIDCGQKKPVDDFYRLHKGDEARQSRCKPCDNRKRAGAHTRLMRGDPVRVTVRRNENGDLEIVKELRT